MWIVIILSDMFRFTLDEKWLKGVSRYEQYWERWSRAANFCTIEMSRFTWLFQQSIFLVFTIEISPFTILFQQQFFTIEISPFTSVSTVKKKPETILSIFGKFEPVLAINLLTINIVFDIIKWLIASINVIISVDN